MKYHWIIDAGHGGLDSNGHYHTDPKIGKLWEFEDGFTAYEGDINRKIATKLYKMMVGAGIDFSLIYDELEDWSLTKRVLLANSLYAKKPNSILISIHSNAGKGKGFEVFTSPGEDDSDIVAKYFTEAYKKYLSQFPLRKDLADGDDDKEAKFTMIIGPKCPAVLVENLFFDNRSEAEFLCSEEGQLKIAATLFAAVTEVENNLNLNK